MKNLSLKYLAAASFLGLLLPAMSFAARYGAYSRARLFPGFIFFHTAVLIIGIAVYIYTSFAYMTLAQKLGVQNSWLAWIPVANLYLISKMARMHWWPMLLLLTFFIPLVNIICFMILAVFTFIWAWRIFQRVGKPGWWVLFILIPVVGSVIFLILLGIAAWGETKKNHPMPPSMPASPRA